MIDMIARFIFMMIIIESIEILYCAIRLVPAKQKHNLELTTDYRFRIFCYVIGVFAGIGALFVLRIWQ